MSLGLMMSAESDLMLPYSDNLLHGGDFGELDRVMLTADLFEGVTIPQLDFDSGDLFSSSINDRDSYDDEKSMWNGDIGKQGVAESEENKAATNKMHHLSLESMEETPYVQFTEAKLEPEPSILMGYSSASNVITSSYPSLTYTAPPLVSPNSQLPTSFGQAAVVSTQQVSLPNGQGNLPNGQSGLSNGPIGLPNGQMNMSNGSSDILTRSASKELVLDDNEIFSSPLQFSSAPMTGTDRSIEVRRFGTKEDVSEDLLSPLPTYTHKPCMMQRSFSSHSLGQLRITPRVQEPTSFYPQYSTPMYSSVLELSSPDLQGMNIRPSFKAMRRVCSAGDIQTLNGIHMSHGSTSPLTPDNLSIEEAGFKIGRYSAEERKERIHRYRMKRSERNFNKKIKYACRKTLADSRPRIRGRFARNEDAGDAPPSSHHDEDDEDEVDAVQEDDDDLLLSNNSGTHAREMIRIRSFQRSNGYPFGF